MPEVDALELVQTAVARKEVQNPLGEISLLQL